MNLIYNGKKSRLAIILLLMLALALAACGGEAQQEESVAALPSPTMAQVEQPQQPEQEAVPTQLPAVLPPPDVAVMTNTPPPATNTPEPTDTPEATNTPEPTAVPPTAVPVVPTAVPPTAVPPTEPPPPTAPPVGINGLIASEFTVEDTEAGRNDQVWFRFNVANSTGGDVPYYSLGVMPKKDGVDRKEWYQQSWKGEDSVIDPGGKEWRDNIKLPESGDYTLRLVICFDAYESCTTRSGTYHSLSQEVPVRIR